eukprot:GFUD01005569.1.p1 GENE.GFUD01005569.1~~GFUD01005569.1.p1  ORF type:complete len:248 (-),score=65.70 GFUD01005569.1:93-836(-)
MRVLLLLCFWISVSFAINCPGCTPLDGLSFDKIVHKFRASLVKFDVAYPYGDQHDEFAKVAKDAAEVGDLFIGEVGIKDYAEKDNQELAERFEITKDDYPTAILFVKNAEGKVENFRFVGEFKADSLKNFLRQKSGIYLPLPGCIEEFDLLVDKLIKSSKEEQKKVLREAEDLWDKVHGPKMHKRADIYVKIMRKIVDIDISFVKKEEERLKKITGGKKITPEKKEEMEERLNILKSFSAQGVKEEL